MTERVSLPLPPKIRQLFIPARGEVMYRAAWGGRGSGKSYNFALMAGVWGASERLRILCTRDLQVSIKESFHAEVKNAIQSTPFLAPQYDIGVDFIRGRYTGTEFIFRGLRHNTGSIKSLAQVDLCIVEEAEDVSEASWVALEPTIRAEKSEIWVIWNPRIEGSPVDKRLRQTPPARSVVAEVNYWDNPKFPPNLEVQRQHAQRTMDPNVYAHIWEGAYLAISDAQVLRGKFCVEPFVPGAGWDGPYFGADWGFSQDPTALVKCWIYQRRLYVEFEAYGIGVEIDHLPRLFDTVAGVRQHVIRADSARPETISYMQRQGFKIQAAPKWSGSVEDGVAHLRGYDQIVIHPRCKHTLEEARLWSYKTDRLTGDVLPVLVDANNHAWDAVRYALAPLIRQRCNDQFGLKVPGL